MYQSAYRHVGKRGDCGQCDTTQLIERPARRSVVHVGPVASSDKIVRDTDHRQRLAKLLLLCVQMEASGTVGVLPTLIIRGISDYADSHKNDDWQELAV